MVPNVTALTEMSVSIFFFFFLHCILKRDGVERMFPFTKRDNNKRGSRYDPRNN